jgi:hypothetical protein
VFAFEPAPHTHDGLRRQICLNGLDTIVTRCAPHGAARDGELL